MTPSKAPIKYLSKSSYMAGLNCHRKLWQLLWDRDSAAPDDGMSQLIMEYGNRFGELSHTLFPDVTLINIDIFNLNRAVEDTRQAIDAGTEVIMEAAFCHGQCRILADIVEKQPDGSWHLIEVKSSTRVKDEHIPDLAYQKWVMEKSGYRVSRCYVIHADKSGIWPDIGSIFNRTLVSNRVPSCFCSRIPSLDTRRIAAQHKGTLYIAYAATMDRTARMSVSETERTSLTLRVINARVRPEPVTNSTSIPSGS